MSNLKVCHDLLPHYSRGLRKQTTKALTFSQSPVCTPSRASLLTGKYPLACRTVANDLPLPEDEVTFAEVMSAAGYRTAYVGKWHIGTELTPADCGFEGVYYAGYGYPSTGIASRMMLRQESTRWGLRFVMTARTHAAAAATSIPPPPPPIANAAACPAGPPLSSTAGLAIPPADGQ